MISRVIHMTKSMIIYIPLKQNRSIDSTGIYRSGFDGEVSREMVDFIDDELVR